MNAFRYSPEGLGEGEAVVRKPLLTDSTQNGTAAEIKQRRVSEIAFGKAQQLTLLFNSLTHIEMCIKIGRLCYWDVIEN